jgi:hypothetical protein
MIAAVLNSPFQFATAPAPPPGISLLSSLTGYSSNGNDFTTAAMDTTGASLIVVSLSDRTTGNHTFTDSRGNTWIALPRQNGGSLSTDTLFYCFSPSVGTGHTFTTTTGSLGYPGIAVLAFSGVSNYDARTGASNATQPGSLTPANANSLIVLSAGNLTSPTAVDSGFTIGANQAALGLNYSSLAAYLIQTTPAAVNPTISPGSSYALTQAAFY